MSLANQVKLYGSLTVNGVTLAWDYANNEAVPMHELVGDRLKASEDAKLAEIASDLDNVPEGE